MIQKQYIFIFCLLLSISSGFSLKQYSGTDIGIQYWKIALITYCSADNISNWTCGVTSDFSRMTDIQVFTNTSTDAQGYGVYSQNDNTVYIAFRGTLKNVENIISDIDILYTDYDTEICDDCRVSNGFNNAYNSLSSQVLTYLSQIYDKYPNAQLAVTGHSLGAAMATICAIDLAANYNYQISYFFTFGSPRVGNKQFADFFNSKIGSLIFSARVVHYRDIVPHFPLHMFGDYEHVNTEVWYTSDDNLDYVVCPMQEQQNCSDSISLLNLNNSDHDTYFNLEKKKLVIIPSLATTSEETTTDSNDTPSKFLSFQ